MLAKLLQEMILTLADDNGRSERRYSLRAAEVNLLKQFIEAAPESGGLGKTNFLSAVENPDVKREEQRAIVDEAVLDMLVQTEYAIDTTNMSAAEINAITTEWFPHPDDTSILITINFADLMNDHLANTKLYQQSGGRWTVSQAKKFIKSARFPQIIKKYVSESLANDLSKKIGDNMSDLNVEKSYQNLMSDPTYYAWYERIAPQLEKVGKLDNFIVLLKRCKKTIGGTNYFSSIIDALMDIPDASLVSSLFSINFKSGGKYQIPSEWLTLADINAYNAGGSSGHSVGRGEFVIPFLSSEIATIGGKNADYDIDIGGALWEVKYVDKTKLARLSGGDFGASVVMEVLKTAPGWSGMNTTSLSIETIEKNREIIERIYGNMPNFQRDLSKEVQAVSLSHVAGIIFMNNKYELRFVATEDVEFVRATSGAYIVSWERPGWCRS